MDVSAPQTAGESAPSESQAAPNRAESTSSETIAFPKSLGWVSDFEGILTEEEIQRLSQRLEFYEKETSNEIAIMTSRANDPEKAYHLWLSDIANVWGIGKKEKDNGVLIGVNLSQRQIGIATGLGMEEILTDAECQKIINETMILSFQENDVYGAFNKALDEIIKQLN